MDLSETQPAIARRHPWETARQSFFEGVLQRANVLAGPRRVLDVGSGDGFPALRLLAALPTGSTAVLWDAYYEDSQLAASRPGVTFTRARPEGRFDLVCMLDVLEHVPGDRDFLSAIVNENLAEGGWALVSVPAWPALYSAHDRQLRHMRRYTPEGCRALLAACGLRVIQGGGLFHALLAPRAVARSREWVLGAAARPPRSVAMWKAGAWATALVDAALRVDNAVSRVLADAGLDVPGLSWWALCRK